jgi:hypothetical protein
LIAEILANALTRKQSEESLHQAFSEIEQLKEQLHEENVYLQEEIKLTHNFLAGKCPGVVQCDRTGGDQYPGFSTPTGR